ncbi:uncharacterized protein LOC113516745 [Galleria mellonella]|uniref:Uncharacterized protein LOC113516745 n=1 Tax=Galleria mellonella TaxID=7137 RepID=A0A6J1WWI3_GALME|nr:uncharacterized protein LOC113516745 [Galleria mellonella]
MIVLLTCHQRIFPSPLSLRGQSIKSKHTVRYLGVEMHRPLRITPLVDYAVTGEDCACHVATGFTKDKLSLGTKAILYKTYIHSRITYASPVCCALCSAIQRRRMQVQQNIALRLFADTERYIHNDGIAQFFGVPSLEDFVRQLARSMFNRADDGYHSHLRDLNPFNTCPHVAMPALPVCSLLRVHTGQRLTGPATT